MSERNPRRMTQAELIDEVEILRETLAQMRAALRPNIYFPIEWGLTSTEQQILQVLTAAGTETCSVERLLVAVEAGRWGTHHGSMRDHTMSPESLKVMVSRIRKRLTAAGIPHGILVAWGVGYRLTPSAAWFYQSHMTPAAKAA